MSNPRKIITAAQNEINKFSLDIAEEYGEKYMKKVKNSTLNFLRLACVNTNIVIDTIEAAVTRKYPSHVYTPCRNIATQVLCHVLQILPCEFCELLIYIFIRILGYPSSKDISYRNYKSKN